MQDGDVIVIAQKIVSKAEGRRIRVDTFVPSDEALALSEITGKDNRLIQAILEESKKVIRAVPNTLIAEHKNGFICANAGIDHSNVNIDEGDAPDDWILLLPEDADRSASEIRAKLEVCQRKEYWCIDR